MDVKAGTYEGWFSLKSCFKVIIQIFHGLKHLGRLKRSTRSVSLFGNQRTKQPMCRPQFYLSGYGHPDRLYLPTVHQSWTTFSPMGSSRSPEHILRRFRRSKRHGQLYLQINPILIRHVPVFTEFVKAALEDALAEERQRGKEFAEEVKDETKKEMLQYIRAKQEVRRHV